MAYHLIIWSDQLGHLSQLESYHNSISQYTATLASKDYRENCVFSGGAIQGTFVFLVMTLVLQVFCFEQYYPWNNACTIDIGVRPHMCGDSRYRNVNSCLWFVLSWLQIPTGVVAGIWSQRLALSTGLNWVVLSEKGDRIQSPKHHALNKRQDVGHCPELW
jgi:hypothetical protein